MVNEFLIHGKVKQVGNSIAIFVPADERDKYHLVPNSDVVLELQKKQVVKSMFGALKGKSKYIPFTHADRVDMYGKNSD